MSVDFEYYKVFYYVARHHSITRAAAELSLTQPSVTRAIQSLEGQLGCRLFIRSRKGMSLTTEGQMVYQRICSACELLFSAQEELEQMRFFNSGLVRIGTDDLDIRRDFFLPLVERYHDLYPRVRLRLVQNDGPELTQALETGVLDFCLVADAAPKGAPSGTHDTSFAPSIACTPILEYPDVVIVGKRFAHLAEQALTLQALNQYPLIVWTAGTATRSFFEQVYTQRGLTLTPAVELSNIEMQILLTEQGLGYSFVPRHCVEDKLADGRLFSVPLTDCHLRRRLQLMTSKSRSLSPPAQRFLDLLSQAV